MLLQKLWINWVPCSMLVLFFPPLSVGSVLIQCTMYMHASSPKHSGSREEFPYEESSTVLWTLELHTCGISLKSPLHLHATSSISFSRDACCVSLTDKVRPWSKARQGKWMRRCTCSVEWFLCSAAFDRSIDMSSRWSNSLFWWSVAFCCWVLLTGVFERCHIAIHSDKKQACLSWSYLCCPKTKAVSFGLWLIWSSSQLQPAVSAWFIGLSISGFCSSSALQFQTTILPNP